MPRKKQRETEMLSLRIAADLKQALAALAESERRSLTVQVEIVVEAGLDALGVNWRKRGKFRSDR